MFVLTEDKTEFVSIPKSRFVTMLNDIKNVNKMGEELDRIFAAYGRGNFCSGFAFCDDLMIGHVVELLDCMTNTDDWVSYWVEVLECGQRWNSDCVIDEQDNSVDISTPEKLYDFLICSAKKECE